MGLAREEAVLDVFWHPDVLLHDAGDALLEAPPSALLEIAEPHVEGADRIRNMRSILERGPLAPRIRWHGGRCAELHELLAFHAGEYIDELEAADAAGATRFTATTAWGPGSFVAARTAAGTTLAAMTHIMDGHGRLAYALVRPPGHHAAPSVADGYCFLNNGALAAELALERGARRVAIIDWDVHHGNGTQEGFYERADVLTVSLHMDHGSWGPTHPQSGAVEEVGRGAGRGFNVNVPLPMGAGDAAYGLAMSEVVRPVVEEFDPDIIVVANGQDANQFDPNGRQTVTMAGFRNLGAVARELAESRTGGRLLLVQEGGYQPSYAPFCLHATLEGVLGVDPLLDDPLAYLPDDQEGARRIVAALSEARKRILAR